jgi:hypothetical protein
LYSSISSFNLSSVSKQSSELGVKSHGRGMLCVLVTFLHPTESNYHLNIELQYLVLSKTIS